MYIYIYIYIYIGEYKYSQNAHLVSRRRNNSSRWARLGGVEKSSTGDDSGARWGQDNITHKKNKIFKILRGERSLSSI